VVIRDGLEYVNGAHCVIVDDLVKSGGTLIQCAKALEAGGAKYVSAYVTHACFPEDSWRKFAWEDQSASIDHRAIGAAAAASSGRSKSVV
jgi:phosphoribosylpyrophosphate synthetase